MDRESVIARLKEIPRTVADLESGINALGYDERQGLIDSVEYAVRDAVALLERKARVIPLAAIERVEVAWAEDRGVEKIVPVIVIGRLYERVIMVRGQTMGKGTYKFHPSAYDYNRRWRLWSRRPTEEEREAEAWRD